MARGEVRRIIRGAVTVERELVVGRRYVVDPPWGRHSAKHVGRTCTLLGPGDVPWADQRLRGSEKVAVRFVDDGTAATVRWYMLRPEE